RRPERRVSPELRGLAGPSAAWREPKETPIPPRDAKASIGSLPEARMNSLRGPAIRGRIVKRMENTLERTAALLERRWRRAVDLLWRESVRCRKAGLAEWERIRSARRRRN